MRAHCLLLVAAACGPASTPPISPLPDNVDRSRAAPVRTAAERAEPEAIGPGADLVVAAAVPHGRVVATSTSCAVLPAIVFEPFDSSPSREAGPILDAVASALDSKPALMVELVGHTDVVEDCQTLSLDRAEAVAGALVRRGVAPERIFVVGRGAAEPARAGGDPDALAANRRVEFRALHSPP